MKSFSMWLIPTFLFGCSPGAHDVSSMPDDLLLAPPESGKGIQLRMTKTVVPGEESYGCRLFQVPEGGLFVHEETVQFGVGGHHVLLHKTPYETIPEMDEGGIIIDAREVHDCGHGVTTRWKVDAVVGGSEIFGGMGMLRGLPDGVAVHLPENTVLAMSVHYLNASSSPIPVDARMNLSTIASKDVKMEAGLLYLDNQLLHIPAMGTSSARMQCPVPSDLSIVSLQSHMHARGVGFEAMVVEKSGASSKTIYQTKNWVEPPVESYAPFLALSKGQTIELRCDYASTESRAIGYGPQSTDEMCQLIGPYFPRDKRFEKCKNEGGQDAVQWIGQGTSDGVTTRTCIECATSVGGHEYVACMVESCPAIAEQLSTVVRCHLARGAAACNAELETLSNATCL